MKRIVVVGSLNIDLVLPVTRLPRLGETLSGGDLSVFPGGKGANQACAVAKLGGTVTMLGQLGTDPFAGTLRASLKGAGVDTSAIGTSQSPTGSALIYVLPDGENSIVISPGANGAVSPEYVESGLAQLAPVAFVLAQMEVPLESAVTAFHLARSANAVTILDPAPAATLCGKENRELRERLLSNTSWLTPNQSEAALLLDTPNVQIVTFDDAAAAAQRLLALGPSGVVMKLGALGCLVASGGKCEPVAGFAVEAVDTTAAGDTFNGAFAVALSEGATPVEAARFANAAAALSVTRLGAQPSIPTRDETDRLLTDREVAQCS